VGNDVSLGKSWLIFITATAFTALLVTLGAPHDDAPLGKPLTRPPAAAETSATDICSHSEHRPYGNTVPTPASTATSQPEQPFRRLIDNPRDATWAGWQSLSPADLDLLEREGIVGAKQRQELKQLDRKVRSRGSVPRKIPRRTQ